VLKKRNNLIFNHFGIFVKNIKISEKHLSAFIEKGKSSKLILDKKLGIKAKLFYDKKKICYELVEPYGKNNPVSGFLKRGTNILNHVAYTSKNFDKTLNELRDNKFMQISIINYSKLFKSRIVFFISPLNYIIEIIELKK
jgi:methylmalonyl-CoA/ethylmalonyl-CoA epimerase|tara:strand:+ start:43 stop:462 length:420 start_codon:yes stop_codon:yes gene_type:complete